MSPPQKSVKRLPSPTKVADSSPEIDRIEEIFKGPDGPQRLREKFKAFYDKRQQKGNPKGTPKKPVLPQTKD